MILRTTDGYFFGSGGGGRRNRSVEEKLAERVSHSAVIEDNPGETAGVVATSKDEAHAIDFQLGPKEIADRS